MVLSHPRASPHRTSRADPRPVEAHQLAPASSTHWPRDSRRSATREAHGFATVLRDDGSAGVASISVVDSPFQRQHEPMRLDDGFDVEDPPLTIRWGTTVEEVRSLLAGRCHQVTLHYLVFDCMSLNSLDHQVGLHFRDDRLVELEFFRKQISTLPMRSPNSRRTWCRRSVLRTGSQKATSGFRATHGRSARRGCVISCSIASALRSTSVLHGPGCGLGAA